MSQFGDGGPTPLSKTGSVDTYSTAVDGASFLFDQGNMVRADSNANPIDSVNGFVLAQSSGPLFRAGTGGSFRDALRDRVQGTPVAEFPPADVQAPRDIQQGNFPNSYPSVRDRVPTPVSNLPRLQYDPPQQVQPSLLEGTNVKKTDLNTPYVSETSDRANILFESLARAGASAYFVNRDYTKRSLAVEKQIAATELVSSGTKQSFSLARDGLLNSLKIPIQNAEVGMEALYKNYPIEHFQGSVIPKINGNGRILMPHPWDFDKMTIADQAVAERYLKLTSLREQLTAHWPPVASTHLGRLPVNVAGMPIVQAEKIVAEAAKFDAAGTAFTSEVSGVLAKNQALRAANTDLVFKSVGAMAGAWLTNTATDAVLNTKHGPSKLTWAVDLISPAVLFTNRSMLTKYGVVAGSHLLAKIYDKWTDEP